MVQLNRYGGRLTAGPSGRPSSRNCTEVTVAAPVAAAEADRTAWPERSAWAGGPVSRTVGGTVPGVLCESTVTFWPVIVSSVSVTSLAVSLSVKTCCGSTSAWRTYVPSGTPRRSIGWPASVWSYWSAQPTDQPSGLFGSLQSSAGG